MYVVKEEYRAKKIDELSIDKGDFVYALEKNYYGWWKIR